MLLSARPWGHSGLARRPSARAIGVLMSWTAGDPESLVRLAAFRDGLEKLGWREGHNLRLDVRWATSDTGLTQAFAKELVALQPDIILSPTTPTTTALLQHTRAIPVIFVAVSDPVGSGFVSKFSEPGSNVTGFINVEPTMAGKWLELLKEIAPRVRADRLLVQPSNGALCRVLPWSVQNRRGFVACAGSRGARVRRLDARIRHRRAGP